MKHKFIKIIACLSLAMMVFSAVAPGAFADDTGTVNDNEEFNNHKMGHGPRGGPGMDGENEVAAMEFDSEEEEFEFLVEKETEFINHRIEKLNAMLENIDETGDENITEEAIEEQITELEAVLEDIESATKVDELKEIMEDARDSTFRGMRGEKPEMEEMGFETEEEEMEFLIEKQTESINHRIERMNEMLGNIDEIDDKNVTEESIEEQITELETLLKKIESATTMDELKEVLEEHRENNPHPHGHRGEHGPMNYPDFQKEEVTAE